MAVNILCDGINPIEDRPTLEKVVGKVVGKRHGEWKVWLTQGTRDPGFPIRVDGPDGAFFCYRFLIPREHRLDFVEKTIRDGVARLSRAQEH